MISRENSRGKNFPARFPRKIPKVQVQVLARQGTTFPGTSHSVWHRRDGRHGGSSGRGGGLDLLLRRRRRAAETLKMGPPVPHPEPNVARPGPRPSRRLHHRQQGARVVLRQLPAQAKQSVVARSTRGVLRVNQERKGVRGRGTFTGRGPQSGAGARV